MHAQMIKSSLCFVPLSVVLLVGSAGAQGPGTAPSHPTPAGTASAQTPPGRPVAARSAAVPATSAVPTSPAPAMSASATSAPATSASPAPASPASASPASASPASPAPAPAPGTPAPASSASASSNSASAGDPVVFSDPMSSPRPSESRAKPLTLPVRERRPLAIWGELGWNSLSGLGAGVTYRFASQIALDAGIGLSVVGIKTGVRARYNFLDANLSPFLGLGVMYGTGTGKEPAKVKVNNEDTSFKVSGSPYVQALVGLDYVTAGGFTFLAGIGYAFLLKDNTTLVAGSQENFDKFRSIYGGGVVLSAALGYSFSL